MKGEREDVIHFQQKNLRLIVGVCVGLGWNISSPLVIHSRQQLRVLKNALCFLKTNEVLSWPGI